MQTERIHSIDIFRGLTIFMMVFVNDLAGVSGIPMWMKHVPAGVDGMTFVDVVFPAFLFIVGMAIPFAVSNREKKSKSPFEFWKHVLIRTLGLLVLGFYMVNAEEMNAEATLIPKRLWSAALYIAAILIWNRYPKTEEKQKINLYTTLKILGVLVLIALAFVYRKGSGDQIGGMTPSWWGILGLIGWAYLISVILYKISNKQFWIFSGLFIAMLAFLLVLRSDFNLPTMLTWFQNQSGHISHTIIVMAGIISSMILAKGGLKEAANLKIRNILIFGLLLLLGGYFCQPFGGISKIGASPSWSLYSAAICCFLFPLIYWLVDIREVKNWANFLSPAGKNPLLTYILPALFYAILGYSFIPDLLTHGIGGFMKAVIFSLFILWLADWLTKRGIRMQL